MPIAAVIPVSLYKNNVQSSVSDPVSTSSVSNKLQNNNLIDLNYGRSLVKMNDVSFKGGAYVVNENLSKKVSTAFSYLMDGDILLLGKDLETAKKHLQETLKESRSIIKNAIRKVVFVKDEKFKSSIVIQKPSEGYDDVLNLTKEPVFFHGPGAEDKLDFLSKGEKAVLQNNMYIATKNPETSFYIDTNLNGHIKDLPKGSIKQFYLSCGKEEIITEANIKNLEKLKDEVVKPAKKITFKDVGGQDEAVAEIKRKFLFQLKYPNFFANNMEGGHGALFVGPPGNGKSRSAEALANEAGVPFYNINGQLLEGEFVGQSAHNISDYFENARKNQPCIMFFDEADAVFGERTGVHKYADQSTNMYLDEITKLEQANDKVYLIAATNHPELMDKAALRRFDTKIEFKNLDTVERCKAVFDVHTKSEKIEGLDTDSFMKKLRQAEFSGSDIANLVREAKMNSIARQGIFEKMEQGTFQDDPNFKIIIIGEDFNQALDKLIAQKDMVKKYSKEKVINGFG